MKKDYYIFGLQRSGTNFVESIMTKNFACRKLNSNKTVWKHSIDVPSLYVKTTPTIVMYKNPYTWAESIGVRNQVDWTLRQKKYPARDECDEKYQIGENNFNIINLAKTYRHFYQTWLVNNPCDKRIVIKYEDTLIEKSRNKILDDIEKQFKMVKSTESWEVPPRGKVSQSRDYDENREKYYLKMKPSCLTLDHIQAINEHVGKDLIEQMGYDIL